MHALRAEERAMMFDWLNLGGININTSATIAQDRIVFPALLPVFVDDLHIFFSHVVAFVMTAD